jgi:hypothetical protein
MCGGIDLDTVDVRCGAKPGPQIALTKLEGTNPFARLCDQLEAFTQLDRHFGVCGGRGRPR